MQGNAPEIDISQMAHFLKTRQKNETSTTLLLGAKVGKLFRNQDFYETLKPFSPSGKAAFNALPSLKQFQECYHILNKPLIQPNDLHLILLRSLQNLSIEASDLILADLIKAKFFNPIVTTNIDATIERSLEMAGLKRMSDFDIFQAHTQSSATQRIPFEAKMQIVKVFGDLITRDYVLKQRSKYIDDNPDLQEVIEVASRRNILMVGMDPVWDEGLLTRFSPKQGFSLCYVNDARPPEGTAFSRLLEENQAYFIAQDEEMYKSFFQILHWHITEDAPDVYTLLVVTELHEQELQFIEYAFAALVNNQPLRSLMFVNYFGVDGIGKTSLLQEIKLRCGKRGIASVMVDASQQTGGIWRDLLAQLKGYQNAPLPVLDLPDIELYTLAINALKEYLATRPLVLLLDSVDTQDAVQVAQIERMLGELLGNSNFLTIIASKQKISFNNKPALTRNLKPFQLKPFDRAGSDIYLNRIGHDLAASDRERIFELTHGYPLAMTVMTQAILGDRLNPQIPEHRSRLFATLWNLVIDKKIFANMESEERDWCRAHISLLSLPRRFNMTLLKELLLRFEPTLASRNPLENWGRLLNQIPRKTGIMDWDDRRDGYTVAEPVRNLFFQRCQLEQPERFHQINSFLSEHNLRHARRGNMKAWREYLYHCAFTLQAQDLSDAIQRMVKPVRNATLDARIQLLEEVARDDELKEVLGDSFGFLTSLINEDFHTGDNGDVESAKF